VARGLSLLDIALSFSPPNANSPLSRKLGQLERASACTICPPAQTGSGSSLSAGCLCPKRRISRIMNRRTGSRTLPSRNPPPPLCRRTAAAPGLAITISILPLASTLRLADIVTRDLGPYNEDDSHIGDPVRVHPFGTAGQDPHTIAPEPLTHYVPISIIKLVPISASTQRNDPLLQCGKVKTNNSTNSDTLQIYSRTPQKGFHSRPRRAPCHPRPPTLHWDRQAVTMSDGRWHTAYNVDHEVIALLNRFEVDKTS
jgi:hypothetical protein